MTSLVQLRVSDDSLRMTPSIVGIGGSVVVVVVVVVVVDVVVVVEVPIVAELTVSVLRGCGRGVVVMKFSGAGDFLQPELILTRRKNMGIYFDMFSRLVLWDI